MTLTQALVLGAVQGATEFLPVSSDGHLVLVQRLLGLPGNELRFDLTVHAGTLLAMTVVLWADLLRVLRDRVLLRNLVVTTGVTGALGLPLRPYFERTFDDMRVVGGCFLLTGVLLFLTRTARATRPALGVPGAALVGLAQCASLLPGLSRSGATLAAALLCGVEREAAARYAFLCGVPAVAGALVLSWRTPLPEGSAGTGALVAGTVVAFAVGLVCLRVAIAWVSRGAAWRFALYLWPLGAAVLLLTAQGCC